MKPISFCKQNQNNSSVKTLSTAADELQAAILTHSFPETHGAAWLSTFSSLACTAPGVTDGGMGGKIEIRSHIL